MANPGHESALIVPVLLPTPLDDLRRRDATEKVRGLPPHVTLLHPFAPPAELDDSFRRKVGEIVVGHEAFSCRLARRGEWPGVLYASVEPESRFASLNADLLQVFPEFPSHRGEFDFVPHVTIIEGPSASSPDLANHPAWESLPAAIDVTVAHLVVRGADGWRVKWVFDLRPTRRPGGS